MMEGCFGQFGQSGNLTQKQENPKSETSLKGDKR